MWSLGITALELYKGYPPYARLEAMETIIRTCQGDPPSFHTYPPSSRSPSRAFRGWVGALLRKTPDSRANVEKAMNHRFLTRMTIEEGKQRLVQFLQTIPDLEHDSNSVEEGTIPRPSVQVQWQFA